MKWFKRKAKNIAEGDAARESRRGFFKAGAGAVVGGAAVAMSGPAAAAEPVRDPNAAGYRETDHVKRFYDSARM